MAKGAARTGKAFEEIFKSWSTERPTFQEAYKRERLGYAVLIRSLYQQRASLLKAIAEGKASLFSEELVNPRIEVLMVESLAAVAVSHGMDLDKAKVYILDEFLVSEEALRAPANEINALLMAAIARKAASGQKHPPSRGMWNDVRFISAFLPYCDVMFIDNYAASLIHDEPLASAIGHWAQIFSTNTKENFISYLAELEARAGENHSQLVVDTYGEDWLIPYRTILEYERQREAEKNGA